MNLKTTAEERASGRDLFAEDWDPADVQDAPTRRIEAAFSLAPRLSGARAAMNAISTVLGPLETK